MVMNGSIVAEPLTWFLDMTRRSYYRELVVMSWCRARVRSTAAVVLLSLAALGGLSPSTHAADCHDADCYSLTVAHDPAGHSLTREPAGDGQSAQHCILCHLARSFRPRPVTVYVAAPPLAGSANRHVSVVALPAIVPATQPPLRAPPIAPAVAL
jgi:hypothetical protein